jgi:hypothetical protein
MHIRHPGCASACPQTLIVQDHVASTIRPKLVKLHVLNSKLKHSLVMAAVSCSRLQVDLAQLKAC